MMELPFDGCKIVEDVSMIELEIVENRGPWPVVDEFRALVEEGGVVLVRLDDKPPGRGKSGGDGKVLGHAADQEAGIAAGALEDPSQHGSYGRFAMRSRDCEDVPLRQHVLGEPLRAGGVAIAAVEDGLHEGVPSGDHIAHDPQVRLQGQLVRSESLDQIDAERLELLAHRRIDVRVATGDAVARRLRDGGDTAHECAADAEDVDVGRHSETVWKAGRRFYATSTTGTSRGRTIIQPVP